MNEHECRLYSVNFANGDLKQTILVAGTPNLIKSKSTEIFAGLIERGLMDPGSWKFVREEEIFAYLPGANTGLTVHLNESATVAAGRS